VYTGDEDDGLSIVIAMEDVTEQIKMQEEQKIARLQLYRSARLASIGTLASGVAHEINNPLTAILGFSSALLERTRGGEEVEQDELDEYLDIINHEALRCRDIVENLSKFAREGDIETGRIDLRTCIDDAIKLTQTRAIRANVKVTNTIDTETLIKSNTNKLEQVFITVISNCIDFCPPGSKVTFTSVPSGEPDRYFRVHITDNGPGISAEILPKVFDPFFTTKEVGKGTGMGLAICHKIMEECNGRIDIDSAPGKGTTVVIDLPVGVLAVFNEG
jgi:two-component system NtrC family sensor kinase